VSRLRRNLAGKQTRTMKNWWPHFEHTRQVKLEEWRSFTSSARYVSVKKSSRQYTAKPLVKSCKPCNCVPSSCMWQSHLLCYSVSHNWQNNESFSLSLNLGERSDNGLKVSLPDSSFHIQIDIKSGKVFQYLLLYKSISNRNHCGHHHDRNDTIGWHNTTTH